MLSGFLSEDWRYCHKLGLKKITISNPSVEIFKFDSHLFPCCFSVRQGISGEKKGTPSLGLSSFSHTVPRKTWKHCHLWRVTHFGGLWGDGPPRSGARGCISSCLSTRTFAWMALNMHNDMRISYGYMLTYVTCVCVCKATQVHM